VIVDQIWPDCALIVLGYVQSTPLLMPGGEGVLGVADEPAAMKF